MPSCVRPCAAFLFLSAVVLSTASVAATPETAVKTEAANSSQKQDAVLPAAFDGWQRVGAPVFSTDAASSMQAADANNVPVLKEYGFNRLATASYINNDNKLSIRELRFDDATGAYGAFTFYRVPGSAPAEIAQGAASNGTHVVFWTGATVVEAVFDHLTVTSATELRDLAGDIPAPFGAKKIPPPLPGYLPEEHREITYTRYALGPESYVRSGGVLPPDLVDFGRGAEALTGTFDEHNGTGQLTLIEYPTPQIAIDREKAIAAFIKAGEQPSWPQPMKDSNTQALLTRRSGPLVAVTSGAFDDADARGLLDRIHYEATVTWNHPQGYVSEPNRAARLLVGAVTLFGILGGIAILVGIFFGGGRLLVRRMQGKPASSVDEAEFIKLDLR